MFFPMLAFEKTPTPMQEVLFPMRRWFVPFWLLLTIREVCVHRITNGRSLSNAQCFVSSFFMHTVASMSKAQTSLLPRPPAPLHAAPVTRPLQGALDPIIPASIPCPAQTGAARSRRQGTSCVRGPGKSSGRRDRCPSNGPAPGRAWKLDKSI